MSHNPAFSIVYASYQKVTYLRACLRGLELLSDTHSFEVIVVNDGSTDGTKEFLDSYTAPYDLRSITTPHLGLAAARNAGIEATTGELVVVLDNDCLIENRTLDGLWRAHQKNPLSIYISTITHVPVHNVARVMDKLVNRTLTFPLDPALITEEESESTLQRILSLVKTRLPDLEGGWFGAQGPSICASRKVFASLHGYDTNIKSYGMEDFDLAFRFHFSGGHFIWVPESAIYHLDHGHNANVLFSATAKSTSYFYRKHCEHPETKPFLEFLSGKLSFLECNNRMAEMAGRPPCNDKRLDLTFSVYRMLEVRQSQLRENTEDGTSSMLYGALLLKA
jgi:GT2 family glycosyltransferase